MEREKIREWEKEFEKRAFHWFKFSQRAKLWREPQSAIEPLKQDIKNFIKQILGHE